MNFSHGSYEVGLFFGYLTTNSRSPQLQRITLRSILQYHQSVIDNARESARTMPGRPLAIALDTVSYPPIMEPCQRMKTTTDEL